MNLAAKLLIVQPKSLCRCSRACRRLNTVFLLREGFDCGYGRIVATVPVAGPLDCARRDGGHHFYFDQEVWPDQAGDHPKKGGRLMGDELVPDFDVGPGCPLR